MKLPRDEILTRFLDQLPYTPYPFQEEALLAWFTADHGILVSAPTGMGKTLIAEAAIFEALHARRRVYYTTPLIALTDQKFREFQAKAEAWGFSREDVGLITGNRRVNPNALVSVVVAEILLNHLLSHEVPFDDVSAVVMDEFHYFNDLERGSVWELSLVLLPPHAQLMLLSATVGNAPDFVAWLSREHRRNLTWVHSNERRVPLEFIWVGDKLLTELLPELVSGDDQTQRTPALVFCFNRDECWEVAEVMKGLSLLDAAKRAEVEARLLDVDFSVGVGPKLRHMLIRGVGVHHAGVLPKYKEVIEDLFLRKLIPLVICTETLAAGINLPARSVVLSTLLKGPPREKKLIAPAAAHQMFGRAGRPQFDATGFVYSVAHEDDARIAKWKRKYDQIPPSSKDPSVLRMKRDLERKRPTRRSNQQYWTEGQFKSLIAAGPGKIFSRTMIPYSVLVFLLKRGETLAQLRDFLRRRFNSPERIEGFQRQLDHMLDNLAAAGYVEVSPDRETVTLGERVDQLTCFRSMHPLFGVFLAARLNRADRMEKLLALESVLPLPSSIESAIRLPEDLPPGPLEANELRPMLIQMGLIGAAEGVARVPEEDARSRFTGRDKRRYDDDSPETADPSLPEMLKLIFDSGLPTPEDILVQPKWVAGGVMECGNRFYAYIKNRALEKQEGLILRHLLRLVILAGEFVENTQDPEYDEIRAQITQTCQEVDSRFTEKFLAEAQTAGLLIAKPEGLQRNR